MEIIYLPFPLERTFRRTQWQWLLEKLEALSPSVQREEVFISVLFLNTIQGISCLIVASGRQMFLPVKVMVASPTSDLFCAFGFPVKEAPKMHYIFPSFMKQNTIEVL